MIVYKRGNSSKINLTSQMFIAKGGQAEIYGRGGTVYKIYLRKKEAVPLAKIKELQCLTKQNILNPQDPLINTRKEIVGFTMHRIKNTLPLCKLFTNEIWRRMALNTDIIIKLVNSMRETVEFIHKHKCIMLDGNEMNYLVDEKDPTIPYFLDVDSYLTPSFSAPSKVYIMPSIRDYNALKISTLSDWFAFGVVTCQLFTGIHPFRGGHPDYKKTDLENRMKDGVSIFNKDVSVPPPTRDFNLIPTQYKEWYIETFEHNKRTPPPIDAGAVLVIPISIQIISSNIDFGIKKLSVFDENIVYYTTQFGMPVVKTTKAIYIGKTKYLVSKEVELVYTSISGIPIFVKIEDEQLKIKIVKGNIEEEIPIKCTSIMISENVLYACYKNHLMEIDFLEQDGVVHTIIRKTWQIMSNSSITFSGVIYQNMIDKAYITIPKRGSCINYPVPELDEYRIISAKHELDICEIIGYKDNKYDKIILTLNNQSYICRIIEDITDQSLNFVVLENGIVISITDDHMEVYKRGSNKITRIQNAQTNSNMVLCKDGTAVRFFTDRALYSITMKGGN